MNRTLIAGALLGLVFSAAAAAGDAPATTPETPAPQVQKGPHPDDMVCKTRTQAGTHFTKRICKTRREWNHQAYADGKDLENMQRGGAGSPEAALGGG